MKNISFWPDAMNGWLTCLSAKIIDSSVNNIVYIDLILLRGLSKGCACLCVCVCVCAAINYATIIVCVDTAVEMHSCKENKRWTASINMKKDCRIGITL